MLRIASIETKKQEIVKIQESGADYLPLYAFPSSSASFNALASSLSMTRAARSASKAPGRSIELIYPHWQNQRSHHIAWEKETDAGKDSTLAESDAFEKLVELVVVSNSEEEMSRNNSFFLVVPRGVSSELDNLSGEVSA